mmetsp:Transcript_63527/g.187543  ORF Transcript_63527/g.187543 Transcript_63527/m.187543 type:complete len:123 (-) Transcript_63527:137-505(-)
MFVRSKSVSKSGGAFISHIVVLHAKMSKGAILPESSGDGFGTRAPQTIPRQIKTPEVASHEGFRKSFGTRYSDAVSAQVKTGHARAIFHETGERFGAGDPDVIPPENDGSDGTILRLHKTSH